MLGLLRTDLAATEGALIYIYICIYIDLAATEGAGMKCFSTGSLRRVALMKREMR